MMERVETDVLVAGSGIAGLMAAVRAQSSGVHTLVLGGSPGASNRISSLNAALHEAPEDEPDALMRDMLTAGGLIGNPRIAGQIANRIEREVVFLTSLGVPFYHEGGAFARRQAAGSSWSRAIYSLGMVGVDIQQALTRHLRDRSPEATFIRHGLLVDLLLDDGQICGALAYTPQDGRWFEISAPSVVLATGGAGRLFGATTNPTGSMGIGYGVALQAGASLVDMEFVSYEPFVAVAPKTIRGRDLPTTVLREGARLRNGLGREFLDTSAAPSKDVICRAMLREVAEGRGTSSGAVYYDLRGMRPETADRYVQIIQALRPLSLRSSEAQIEVMPAQHFLMGGVRIDEFGASDVPGLFAAGEVAGGAHGAHRLAAGGGSEAVAMGAVTGEAAAAHAQNSRPPRSRNRTVPRPELLPPQGNAAELQVLERLRRALDAGCGMLRNERTLRKSLADLETISDCFPAGGAAQTYARRAVFLAMVLVRAALRREESRGDHYRTDHPYRDDATWLGNIIARREPDNGALALTYESRVERSATIALMRQ